jgi:hypothetical protein
MNTMVPELQAGRMKNGSGCKQRPTLNIKVGNLFSKKDLGYLAEMAEPVLFQNPMLIRPAHKRLFA